MPKGTANLIHQGKKPIGARWLAVGLLVFALLVGGVLRLWRIGEKSLWLDEVMSVRLATMDSLSATVKEVAKYDVHPPLYPVLHHLWMRMGSSDGFARIPSAIFGIIAILLMYLLARELFGTPAGLIAALFMALSSYHIYFSQEARQYCLASTLGLLSTLLLVRIIGREKTPSPWLWAAYALSEILCLYAFALNLLLLVAHAVVFLGLRARKNFVPWLVCQVCVALALAPWVPVLMERRGKMKLIASAAAGGGQLPGLGDIAAAFRSWLLGPDSLARWWLAEPGVSNLGPYTLIFLTLLALGMALAGLLSHIRQRRIIFILGTLLFLPILLFLLLPVPQVHVFEAKHLIFLQPLAVLVVVSGARKWRGRTLMAGLIGLLMAINLMQLIVYYDANVQKEDWRSVAAYVKENERSRDLVVVNPKYAAFAFENYFRRAGGKADIIQVPEPFPGKIEQFQPPVERIWLVECRSNVSMPSARPADWLRHRWNPQEDHLLIYNGLLGNLQLGLYEQPPASTTP